MEVAKKSGNTTARRAVEILVEKELGFVVPTAAQRKNIVVAFAKRGMIIYGKAFDAIRLNSKLDLNNLDDIEKQHKAITVYEIKSTNKPMGDNFDGYFFGISAAEVLVAQSLKSQFKFAFVNVNNGKFMELTLNQVFGRAKGIYPTWSLLF